MKITEIVQKKVYIIHTYAYTIVLFGYSINRLTKRNNKMFTYGLFWWGEMIIGFYLVNKIMTVM